MIARRFLAAKRAPCFSIVAKKGSPNRGAFQATTRHAARIKLFACGKGTFEKSRSVSMLSLEDSYGP